VCRTSPLPQAAINARGDRGRSLEGLATTKNRAGLVFFSRSLFCTTSLLWRHVWARKQPRHYRRRFNLAAATERGRRPKRARERERESESEGEGASGGAEWAAAHLLAWAAAGLSRGLRVGCCVVGPAISCPESGGGLVVLHASQLIFTSSTYSWCTRAVL